MSRAEESNTRLRRFPASLFLLALPLTLFVGSRVAFQESVRTDKMLLCIESRGELLPVGITLASVLRPVSTASCIALAVFVGTILLVWQERRAFYQIIVRLDRDGASRSESVPGQAQSVGPEDLTGQVEHGPGDSSAP